MESVYIAKKSKSQMAEDSRRATEEGMKAVAKALADKIAKNICESDSDSNSDSDSGSSSDSVSSDKIKIKKLETRIHYLNLDCANLEVERNELREECNAHKKNIKFLNSVNTAFQEFINFKSMLEKETYSGIQIFQLDTLWADQQKTFTDISEKMNSMLTSNDEYDSINTLLQSLYQNEQEICVKLMLKLGDKILMKQMFCYFTIAFSVIIVIIAILIANNKYYGL